MRARHFAPGLFLAGACTLIACNRIPGEVPNDLRRDWLGKDVALIERVQAALPVADGDSLERVLARLGASDPKQITTEDLGFGGKRTSGSFPGGYVSCHLRAYSLDGALLELGVACLGSGESWPRVRPILERVQKPPLETSNDGQRLAYDTVRRDKQSALQGAVHAALGAPESPSVAVPPALQSALDVLASGEGLVLGTACGVAGTPPRGRREVNLLRKEKRADLLRVALRGTSPEGRVYAAQALLRLATDAGVALAAADAAAIDTLKALPLPVHSCSGCKGGPSTAAHYLDPDAPGGARKNAAQARPPQAAPASGPTVAVATVAVATVASAGASSAPASAPSVRFRLEKRCGNAPPVVIDSVVIDSVVIDSVVIDSVVIDSAAPADAALTDVLSSAAFAAWASETQLTPDAQGADACVLIASSALGSERIAWRQQAALTPERAETLARLLTFFSAAGSRR